MDLEQLEKDLAEGLEGVFGEEEAPVFVFTEDLIDITTQSEPEKTAVEVKPKRKRRTPAEIAAEKAAKAQPVETVQPVKEEPKVIEQPKNVQLSPVERIQVLLKVKKELGELAPNIQADVGYGYLDLPGLRNLLDPILEKNGLVLTCGSQMNPQTGNFFGYFLYDLNNNWIASTCFPHPLMGDDIQKFGAAVTYLRRYALLVMFDLIVEDKDGKTHMNTTKRTPVPAPMPNADKVTAVPAVHTVTSHNQTAGVTAAQVTVAAPVAPAPEVKVEVAVAPKATATDAEFDAYIAMAKANQQVDSMKDQVLKIFGYIEQQGKVGKISQTKIVRGIEGLRAGTLKETPNDKVLENVRDLLILALESK